MKTQTQIVQDRMRQLITESCNHTEEVSEKFNSFHKALLKFYFGCVDVLIDYNSSQIVLWSSKPKSIESLRLYDINEAVSTKISYTNLEETLKGCVENGDVQTRFYKSLLFHYNNVNQPITNPPISA